MKILVIGGSYFLGRVFVMLAEKQHDVTVVNRGNQPLTGMQVREIRGDRHDVDLWKQYTEDVDVVVDFCAYQKNDICTVLENLACRVRQYILISTVDVYTHGMGEMQTESSRYENKRFPGDAGDYIFGKIALEQELREVCARKHIAATILRPALLYGPLNYAPRETVFIQMMARDGVLPVISGAEGRFQFLYVKDGAEAILRSLLREEAYGQSYTLCGDEIVDYEMLAEVLKGVAPAPVQTVEVPLEEALAKELPLPFPATAMETLLCDNAKSKRELGMVYTTLEEGMRKTCRAFWEIFLY